jgi:hypothetical protein
MPGDGSHAAVICAIRVHVMWSFWLRRLSVRRHQLVSWYGNALRARLFVGTAWYAMKPVTTAFNHRLCSDTGLCMWRCSSTLISRSFACMRSGRVWRWSRNALRLDLPQMNVNPRKLKVEVPRPSRPWITNCQPCITSTAAKNNPWPGQLRGARSDVRSWAWPCPPISAGAGGWRRSGSAVIRR